MIDPIDKSRIEGKENIQNTIDYYYNKGNKLVISSRTFRSKMMKYEKLLKQNGISF